MKPKIAVIGLKGLPAFGGAASVGENLISHLQSKYQFTVYSTSSHTNIRDKVNGFRQIIIPKIPFRKLNVFFYYLFSAIHVLITGNYDLVHLHHLDGAFILPILKLRFRVLTTLHGRPQESNKWGKLVKSFFVFNEKMVIKKSNSIVSVSSILKNILEQQYTRKIIYIPNGIDISPPPPVYNPVVKEYLLFAAARIIPLKGCDILLKALINIDFKEEVIIIGDLDQMASYKEEIISLSKSLKVKFTGLIRNKKALFEYIIGSKLFVFPSYSENMSMMLLEAASFKVPLICSNINENKALFTEEEALFFISGDSIDLGIKIRWALGNMKEMKEKAKRAYNKLAREYSWVNIALQYDQLYKSMLDSTAGLTTNPGDHYWT